MKLFSNKKLFSQSRFIFQEKPEGDKTEPQLQTQSPTLASTAETSAETSPDAKKDKVEKQAQDALAELRAKQPDLLPEVKPVGAISISDQPDTAKVDEKSGTIQQPFKSADGKIEGTVSMPKEGDPAYKKTTIVVHFCDDPTKADPKFMENLAKQKEKLGNTIVIHMKAPDGATIEVDQKKVDAMRAILADVEDYQRKYYQDQEPAKKVIRALTVLPFTDPGQAEKASRFLRKVRENSHLEKADRRLVKYSDLYRDAYFSEDFQRAEKDLLRDLVTVKFNDEIPMEEEPPQTEKPLPIGGRLGQGEGGSGGRIGATPSGAESAGPSQSAPGSSSKEAPGSATSESPAPIPPSATEGPFGLGIEKGKLPTIDQLNQAEKLGSIPGKTRFYGDSIMHSLDATKFKWDATETPSYTAVGARTSKWLLEEISYKDESGNRKLKNEIAVSGLDQATILIGTNDIGGIGPDFSTEAIFSRIREIHRLFLERGIRVFACTIPPFGGHNYSNYKNKFSEVNAKRKAINSQIMAESDITFIPLHLKVSEGGLASDEDPNYIDQKYHAKGDAVHPKPTELGELIQAHLKVHLSGGESPTSITVEEEDRSTTDGKEVITKSYGQVIIRKKGVGDPGRLEDAPREIDYRQGGINVPAGTRHWPKNQPLTQKMQQVAMSVKNDPDLNRWGQENQVTIDGVTFVARIETHPPRKDVQSVHRGVTLYPLV